MISLCRYILQGGNPCTQAAIGGEYYCRHHLVARRTVAAATPQANPYRIEKALPLVFPEDRAALQINLFLVMQAFNEGTIGPKSTNIFTRLMHVCAMNLKQGPLYETDRENAVRSVVVTSEGEEIAPAREVPEGSASSDTRSAQEEITERQVSNEAAGDCSVCRTQNEARRVQEDEGSAGERVRDCASGDTRFAQETREEAVIGEAVPHTSNDSLGEPPASNGGSGEPPADDFGGCTDPCYIENVTSRRAAYAEHVRCDLAAGRDPRAWEDFDPQRSRAQRPRAIVK